MHLDEAQLNELHDGRLEGPAADRARAHLRSCRPCQVRLEEIQQLALSLESLPEVALSHDLSAPVLDRLRPGAPTRVWSWLALVEALGATGLATYFWPRIVELFTPMMSGPSLAALAVWIESGRSSLDSFIAQLNLEVGRLASSLEAWSALPPPAAGLTAPLVAALGVAALALGVLGNGVLLRSLPAQPTTTRNRIRPSE